MTEIQIQMHGTNSFVRNLFIRMNWIVRNNPSRAELVFRAEVHIITHARMNQDWNINYELTPLKYSTMYASTKSTQDYIKDIITIKIIFDYFT